MRFDLPILLADLLVEVPPPDDVPVAVSAGLGRLLVLDDAGILAPLLVALAALVLRSLVLAAEAGVNGVGSARAQELGTGLAARSLVRLKADAERTAAAVRGAMTLTLAVVVSSISRVALTLAARLDLGLVPTVLVAALGAFLLVVATDPLPRSIAARSPEVWALRTSTVLRALRWLLSPVVATVGWAGALVLRPFGIPLRFALPPPPLEEIERILTEKPQEGAPEPALVKRLFGFSDRTVKEIMVPRTDMVAIPDDATPDDVVRLVVEEGHTRMPVYKGTLDTIIGVVHVKDLLPLLAHPSLIILPDLLRPPTFVPWNRPIQKVMRELQRGGQQFAIVVDEYGGVAGIVTLEDIVEQLVGDIRDEFDEEEPAVVQGADGTTELRGDTRVAEFNALFRAEVPTDAGYETLAGFLSSLAGTIPGEGDRFFHGGFEFVVVAREPRRVTSVRVSRLKAGEPKAGTAAS